MSKFTTGYLNYDTYCRTLCDDPSSPVGWLRRWRYSRLVHVYMCFGTISLCRIVCNVLDFCVLILLFHHKMSNIYNCLCLT